MTIERGQSHAPTAEFFASNPRSVQLRAICLPIVRALDDLVTAEAVSSLNAVAQLRERIDRSREELVLLGIEPNMHVGEDPRNLRTDPVMLAEYIGGQLIQLDGVKIHLLSMSGHTEETAFWAYNYLGVRVDRRLEPVNDR